MELVLEKASLFKKSIDAIAVLIDEAEFIVDDNGLFLKATDPSQISMISFSLPKSAFKKFDVSGSHKLGVDLDYLSQVLSRSKSSDALSLVFDETSSSIVVKFSGESIRTFKVPLIDISSSELPNPKIEFDAEIVCKGEVLQDALKDSALISSHVTLGVDSSKFYVLANSSKGSLNNETSQDSASISKMEVKSDSKSMYPLDYLQDMMKGASSDTEVSLSLKTNLPVKISYNIDSAELTYFLAPRVEHD